MRILWLCHLLPFPPTGGNLLRTYHLLGEVAKFAKVDALCFVQPRLIPAGMSQGEAVSGLERVCSVLGVHELPFETDAAKLRLAATCVLTRRSYTTSWTYSSEFADAVRQALADPYDLLVLDTVGLVRALPPDIEIPVVLNHHNEEVAMLRRRSERSRPGLARWYFRHESRRLAAECAQFFPRVRTHLAPSELDAEKLRALAPAADVEVIPNGVDTEEHAVVYAPRPGEPFTILFVGGSTWYPNRDAIDWLLDEIWPLCRERIPESRLVLIGRAPTKRSLDAAKHDSRLVVVGYAPSIEEWARRAHAFVCPIRDGGGTRLKVLHALSMGLPLVSTGLGVEGIPVEDGRHYLRAETPQQFADQLARLASFAGDADRISRDGRQFVVERFDWGLIGRKLAAVFQEIARVRDGRGLIPSCSD